MNYLKTSDKSLGFLIGAALGLITLGVLVVCGQAWLLGVVLGWFGVSLAFWQNVVIVLLVGSLFGASRSN